MNGIISCKLTRRKIKKKRTKIEKYHLEEKVVDGVVNNKTYENIARSLVEYVRNRKKDQDRNFDISMQTVRNWWIDNYRVFGDLVNEKRNAIMQKKQMDFYDKGIDLREKVITELDGDAEKASKVAKTSFDHESVARIREKKIKVQESGEDKIIKRSPNVNITQVNVNPVIDFKEQMKKKAKEAKADDDRTIDVEFVDVDDEENDGDKKRSTDSDDE